MSAKTKWTPGPWLREGRFVYALHERPDGVTCNRFFAPFQTGDWKRDATEEECEANATLAVAAPDLVEALIEAADTIEWLAPDRDDCKCSGDFRCVAHRGLAIVRAALAKAQGEDDSQHQGED